MTWRFESATRHGNEAVTVTVQDDAADPEIPEERVYRWDFPLKSGQSAAGFLAAVRRCKALTPTGALSDSIRRRNRVICWSDTFSSLISTLVST